MNKRQWLGILGATVLALSSVWAFAEEPIKIAFVDTGNTGRSVTAEALANAAIASGKLPIAVISRAVDIDPFDVNPEPHAVTLLKKRGLDVSAHKAVQLTPNDIKHADVVLTMTAKHKAKVVDLYPDAKAKVYTLAEYATGSTADVADAWGKPMVAYEKMLAQVDGYIAPTLARAPRKAN